LPVVKKEPPPPPQPKAQEPTPTRMRDGGLKEAIARSSRPTEAHSAPTAGGAYALQVAASQNRSDAERFVTKLKDRGYAPYIVEAEVPGKGVWFRVRLGSFPNKEAASRYLNDFRRETQMDAFVTAK
jgi:cell division septation protein DedD